MEKKIFRFVIAVSLLVFIGFGLPALRATNSASESHEFLMKLLEEKREYELNCIARRGDDCSTNPRGITDYVIKEFADMAASSRKKGDFLTSIALGVPFGLFLTFFVGRWIVTGTMKRSS